MYDHKLTSTGPMPDNLTDYETLGTAPEPDESDEE